MKRFLAFLMSLLMIFSVLASCGRKANSTPGEPTENYTEKLTEKESEKETENSDQTANGENSTNDTIPKDENTNNNDNVGGDSSSQNHDCIWQIDAIIQEKSCVHDGIISYVCSCGERKTEISKALGHSFSEWENVSASTCETNGKDRQICSVCSAENSKILDKLIHDYSVTEEEIDGLIQSTYSCLNCTDSFTVSNEIVAEFESYEPQQLFDCGSSFSFDIICNEDEAYIRENLVIIDTYFEGSEKENSNFAICDYSLENIENSVWRVTPVSSYTEGNTYKAKRSNGVIFKEYGINDLTFSIFKEETNVMDFNDDIIFLQELENKNPGYYPYSIEYSENSGLYWATLGKVDGLKVGNIVCVGDATSTEQVLDNHNSENTFGKIEAITYSSADKIYQVAMSVPNFEEIFDELNVYSTKLQQAGEIEFADTDELASQVATMLYNSEDFINFMGATYVTANEFLENRGAKSVVGTFKDFIDSIKVDKETLQMPKVVDGKITAKIKIVGSVAIPVTLYYNAGSERNIGNVVISFSAYVNLDYLKLESNFIQEEMGNADNEKITRLKLGAVQSVTVGFTFNVEMNIDYSMVATPYVLNTSSRVYHFEGCKHVAAMKPDKIARISAERMFEMINNGSLSSDDECGTCRPISAMKSDNFILNTKSKVIHVYDCKHLSAVTKSDLVVSNAAYGNLELSGYNACESCNPQSRYTNSFSESMLNKMQTQDFGHNLEEIKRVAEGADSSEKSKRLLVAEVPVILGACKVDFEIYVYINFTLKASLTYEYEQTIVNRYGFEVGATKISPYHNRESTPNKNILSITGKTRLDVGALGTIKVSFVGFEKCLYASFNAGCGMYATASGALQQDFINNTNSYMVAYFECGLMCDIYGEIKIPFLKIFVFPFYEGEYPILQLGYERLVYKFTNVPESIVINSNLFSLNRDDLLTVTYFDLLDMAQGTAKLSYLGLADRYTVEYSLKCGEKCYIKNGYIYITDKNESFTDELTVTVKGYDKWNDFKSSNTKIDLEPYSVTITYEPIIYSDGLEFTSNGDGTCYVSGIGICEDIDIQIPPKSPEGDSVTSIGNHAFEYCDSFMSVTIPNSVTNIGDFAFHSCYYLTSVMIPDSVTNIGDYAFDDCDSLTSIMIPDSVTNIGEWAFDDCDSLTSIMIPDSVTNIGERAFYDCDDLMNVLIGNGVTSIGYSAFADCDDLASVMIGNGVIGDYVFKECYSLTSVTLGKGVTSIGCSAFEGCYSLTSIMIPDSVTNIGERAFYDCDDLASVTIGNGVIGDYVFGECYSLTSVTLGNGVTSIGCRAFEGCDSLTSIMIPDSVTNIGELAFYDCDDLASVTIGNGVIGDYAFEYCDSLTSIMIPDSVTNIGERAFYDCDDLASVTIGNSVASIGVHAFEYCVSLTSITIPDSVMNIGGYAFFGCESLTSVTIGNSVTSIGGSAFEYCVSLTSVTIGNSVASIGAGAFEYCESLTSVTIGNSVTSIGGSAFKDCYSIPSITIPDSVTSIGAYAFEYCVSLTSITIPDSVTSIGAGAFEGCESLTSVTVGRSVKSIGNYAFNLCDRLVEVINKSSLNIEKGLNYGYIAKKAIEVHNGDSKIVNKDGYIFYTYEGVIYIATYIGKETELMLPEFYNGDSYEIYESAFEGNERITSVVIPDSVTSIGEFAFAYCYNLMSVTIGNSVTSIGGSAFKDCHLTSVTIGNSVTNIDDDAFYNTRYYNDEANWDNGVLYIGNYLIRANSSISDIYTIKSGTKVIADYAFCNCDSLTNVTIPDSVISMGEGAFYNCSLTNVYITDILKWCNISFEDSYSNPLCCKNLYLNGDLVTELEIPEGVIEINDYAFYCCDSLINVTIPDGVTSIGYEAFSDCYNLTSVTIPDSVTSIGNYAFYNSYITSINFNGTKAQWEAIEKGVRWDLYTSAYTVYCTDGNISK